MSGPERIDEREYADFLAQREAEERPVKQEPLPTLPRHPRRPSLTAAATRAARAKARAWARDRGCALYTGRFCDDDCSGFNTGHLWTGALVLTHTSPKPLALCWDCIPYDGAPLRIHEGHAGTGMGRACVRCGASTDDRGGVHRRGGPFCWQCGSPDDAVYDAWLLSLRANPSGPPPWAGDRNPDHPRHPF